MAKTTINSELQVTSTATFADHVNLSDTLVVTSTATFADHVEADSTLAVTNTATFSDHVYVEDIAIGGGQSITKFLGATVAHDAGSIAAHGEETFTATVTGVLVAGANIAVVSTPTNYQAELITTANVTADDVVTVRIHNTDNGGSIDPPSATFSIGVIHFAT